MANKKPLVLSTTGQIQQLPDADLISPASLGTGTANSTSYLRGDGAWNAIQQGAIISDTAPDTPAAGTLWWDSAAGNLYVYYNDGTSSQWVSAANNTAASITRGMVFVTDYGAVGDGTTDDTDAIQSAIDDGYAIYFPTGSYKVTSALVLRSSTALIGAGKTYTKIVKTDFSGPAIQATDKDNLSISAMTIEGPGRTVGGANLNKGIQITVSAAEIVRNIRLYDIEVDELNDIGIYVGSAAFATWQNVEVHDIGFAAIYIDGGDAHSLIGCTTKYSPVGFYFNKPAGFGPTSISAVSCYAEQHGCGMYWDGAVSSSAVACGVEAPINFDATWSGKCFWVSGGSRNITLYNCLARLDTIGAVIAAPIILIDESSNNVTVDGFDRTLHASFDPPTWEIDYLNADNVRLGFNNFTAGTIRINDTTVQVGTAAAGSTQGTATAITAPLVDVTSSTSGTADGVLLPVINMGDKYTVFNKTANTIKVYPSGTQQINWAGAGTPFSMSAWSTLTFYAVNSGSYYT